jgi:hypothetical protein
MPIIPPAGGGSTAVNAPSAYLVGDLIQDIREAVTDQAQVLPATTAAVAVTSAPGSTLPTGTYCCIVTQRNRYGETLYSAETTALAVGANQGVQVTSPLQPSATTIRAYLTLPGGAAGSEQQYIESTSSPFVISAPLSNSGIPPTRSSAYLPDTDGAAINCSTLYRWVNRGLELASQVAGGLFDYGGLGTTVGVPGYIAPGSWKRISSLWYDGYPLAMDDAGNYFRRNAITASVLASVAVSLFTERMMLEVWPQPARTAASTTLSAALNPGVTTASLVNAGGFLLTNGFALIGTEIVYYSGIVNNVLQNLIRAMAGTAQATSAIGATVQELNIFWQGWRMFAPTFQPGQSALTIPVPVSWNSLLFQYGLGRAKLAEQSIKDFSDLDKKFQTEMAKLNNSNEVRVGPRQVGEPSNALEVWPNFGGGFVVP